MIKIYFLAENRRRNSFLARLFAGRVSVVSTQKAGARLARLYSIELSCHGLIIEIPAAVKADSSRDAAIKFLDAAIAAI